jgi:hypothetical protein
VVAVALSILVTQMRTVMVAQAVVEMAVILTSTLAYLVLHLLVLVVAVADQMVVLAVQDLSSFGMRFKGASING